MWHHDIFVDEQPWHRTACSRLSHCVTRSCLCVVLCYRILSWKRNFSWRKSKYLLHHLGSFSVIYLFSWFFNYYGEKFILFPRNISADQSIWFLPNTVSLKKRKFGRFPLVYSTYSTSINICMKQNGSNLHLALDTTALGKWRHIIWPPLTYICNQFTAKFTSCGF